MVAAARLFTTKRLCPASSIFIAGAVFFSLNGKIEVPRPKAPGHAIVAWMHRPVQGRFAPAAPVAFGNP